MKCIITEFDRRLVDYELDIIAIIIQNKDNIVPIIPIVLPVKGTIFMTEFGNLAYYDIWNNMVSLCKEKFNKIITVVPEGVFNVIDGLKKHGDIEIDKDALLSPSTYFKIAEIFKKNC